MTIKWERSEDGYVNSKCNRFRISPLFLGCTRPKYFAVSDSVTGNESKYCSTQKEAKEWADRIFLEEKKDCRQVELINKNGDSTVKPQYPLGRLETAFAEHSDKQIYFTNRSSLVKGMKIDGPKDEHRK